MDKKNVSNLISIGIVACMAIAAWGVQPALHAEPIPVITLFPPPLIDIDTVC